MVAKSASCLLEKMSWTLPNFSAKLAVSGSSSLAHLMFGDVSSSICSPLCSQFFKISCFRHVSGSCDCSPHACAEGHSWLGSDHLGDLRRELWFPCCDQNCPPTSLLRCRVGHPRAQAAPQWSLCDTQLLE